MNRFLRQALLGTGALLGVVLVGALVYGAVQVQAANASMEKVYDIPPPAITRSEDPAVIARGRHVAEAVAGCIGSDCHGADGSGGRTMRMGPLGVLTGPNITSGGMLAVYTDGEVARLLRYGVRKDGRTVQFMPAQDFSWLPDADLTALISFLRSLPASNKPNGPMQMGLLGKILDRAGLIPVDVARRIQSRPAEIGPEPTPTAAYGRFLVRICTGCHGDHLSGGKIPGAPPSFPTPSNLTPDPTGLEKWTFEDFERLLDQGIKKDGKKLDPFMPIASFRKMDGTERRALFEYLRTLPPSPFGGR